MQILLLYFLLSIMITFIILYICNPETQVILKYPKSDKNLSDLYVDEKGVCYRYKTKEVECKKYK
jgi:hypothetical protein